MSGNSRKFSDLIDNNYSLPSSDFIFDTNPSLQQFVSGPSSAASSVPNTDEEDTDDKRIIQEKRREAHTQAEKKRRESIRKGYNDLQMLLPLSSTTIDGATQKLSKAAVLQKTIEHIEMFQNYNSNQREEINKLRKQKEALECMKDSYSQVVMQHKHASSVYNNQVSDDMKGAIFKDIMDQLFITFDQKVSTNSFQEISGSIISWIENNCKPDEFNDLVNIVLTTYHGSQR